MKYAKGSFCLFSIFSMLGSAIFVVVGMIGFLWVFVALAGVLGIDAEDYQGALVVWMIVSGIILLVIAVRLFFELPANLLSEAAPTEEGLRKAGELYSRRYTAVRAVGFEEQEDEGRSFLLELEDGNTLFLSGQYLDDYEEFPNTEFVVWRRKIHDYVTSIDCKGDVLTPESELPPFTLKQLEANVIPDDGEILDLSVEEVLKRLAIHGA